MQAMQLKILHARWLLDTDQDAEGMKVIADLYGGGDPNNKHARREFREIKEAVLIDVRPPV